MPTSSILYGRVSTDQQDDSLVVQEALNQEYCLRLEMPPVPGDYSDNDTSGSIPFLERPGGKALMARLQHGDIKHLITAKQDRLGRDTLDCIATIRAVWAMGVTPHFTAEGGALPRTSQNELLFEIKASVAQYERNLIRQRTQMAMNHKFNHGELTGNVPFGYDCLYVFEDGAEHLSPVALSPVAMPADLAAHGKVVSKRLLDNTLEQDLIRQMAALRTAGRSLKYIADTLNAAGHFTKLGRAWQCGSVDGVLTSRHTARLLQAPAQPIAQAA